MSFEDSFQRTPVSLFPSSKQPTAIVLENMESSTSTSSLANTLATEISQISANVIQLEQLVKLIGTSKDSQTTRDKIHNLISTTRQLTKASTDNIKIFDNSSRGGPEKRHLQQKLTKDLQIWLKKFQEIYKLCVDKESKTPLMEQPKKQEFPSTFPVKPGYADMDDGSTEDNSLLQREREQFALQSEQEFNNALITEREKGIKEIEKTVLEVNDIFKDLSHIVAEQGVMIDSIESNIERATVETSKGAEELTKASKSQRSSRTKLCCLALLLLAILAVILGFIWLFVLRK